MEEEFKNPKTISGLTELYKRAKQDKHITLKDIQKFLKNKYTSQIHKPLPNRHMHFFPITANKENDLIQIDLMDVSIISTKNKNYKYIFVCVDVYSRKGYTIPMKNKNTLNVIEAFKKFLLLCKPKKLYVIMDQNLYQKNSLIFVNLIILTLIM